MVDIFSSFDPSTTTLHHISPSCLWLYNFIILSLLHPLFWAAPNQFSHLFFLPLQLIVNQCERTTRKHLHGLPSLIVALFLFIACINLLGAIPYSFSTSSHLLYSLTFSLPLWLSLILSSVAFHLSSTSAALLPSGTPPWLAPFLVLIETVSLSVRPITLAVRLAANITAGHIVITLIGVSCVYCMLSPSAPLMLLFFAQAGYIVFELATCFLQAYIFTLLLSLYADDHATEL